MVKIARPPTGGKGHKEEEFPSLNWTATITGGQEFQRRMKNDYSKKSHAQADAAAKETIGAFPDVSPTWVIGGIRSGSL